MPSESETRHYGMSLAADSSKMRKGFCGFGWLAKSRSAHEQKHETCCKDCGKPHCMLLCWTANRLEVLLTGAIIRSISRYSLRSDPCKLSSLKM